MAEEKKAEEPPPDDPTSSQEQTINIFKMMHMTDLQLDRYIVDKNILNWPEDRLKTLVEKGGRYGNHTLLHLETSFQKKVTIKTRDGNGKLKKEG